MMRPFALPSRRARTSCSVLALATVLVVGASPALAVGSFQATGVVTSGTGSITTGSTTTAVTVSTPQTVIDWTPFDTASGGGTINFQPAGTTASFSGSGSFAVLNRINPADSSRGIGLNGTIQALALGIGGAANGSIYFYSPGGFVIGSTAIINVGSLVLSASPITVTSGSFINGPNNTVVFGQAPQAGAAITTVAGSHINASAPDAYVAMVAPKVSHGGSIDVNGSAALVGAEAATINFAPSGLFDIQVTTGTTDSTGVASTGTITGAASTGAADIHRAYLVAVPKNTALTMLISNGGSLGFNVAGAANVVGNTVVLSAGHDISGGSIAGVSAGQGASALANLQVNDSNFTSAVNSESTGFTHFSAFAPMHFYSNLNSHADGEIWFSTQAAAGTIDVDGSLSLSTQKSLVGGLSAIASNISIYNVNGGGRITVDGATSVNTNAYGGWSGTSGVAGGNATGGNVLIDATAGGTVELLGGLTVNANAHAGSAVGAGVNGGTGTGGNVNIFTLGDGSHLTVTGATAIHADGYGGSGNGGECFSCNGSGGDGTGGQVVIDPNNATTGSIMTFNGGVTASADGYGGLAVTGAAGKGTGGAAELYVGTADTLTVNGSVALEANGLGGVHQNGTGGAGIGGKADITSALGSTSGLLTITGNASVDASGTGGGSGPGGGAGGQGTGGTAFILSTNQVLAINGDANVTTKGIGGNAASGTGGAGVGGTATVQSQKSATIGGSTVVSALGQGGNGGSGGSGTGGTVRVNTTTNPAATLTLGAVTASATGIGGDASSGIGGEGNGGLAVLTFIGGSTIGITGNVALNADGRGGASVSGNGADGTGGTTKFGATSAAGSGGQLTVNGDVSMLARGFGGETSAAGGFGGIGSGGIVDSGGSFGTINVSGTLFGSTLGWGGAAAAGTGGDGYGGDSSLDASGATITVGAVDLHANGAGADDSVDGGFGAGGYALLHSSSSLTVTGDASLHANGTGGSGSASGGEGDGGAVEVDASNGSLTANGKGTFQADGFGGVSSGGNGGQAYGGSADIDARNGGNLRIKGALDASVDATGGDGATGGGFATGGILDIYSWATLKVDGALTATASATGGALYYTDFQGYAAGDAVGGSVSLDAQNGLLTLVGGAVLSTDATGGTAGNTYDISGFGEGGVTHVYANAGGTLDLQSTLYASAIGSGGSTYGYGSVAGYGEGGDVRVQATDTNALVTVGGAAMLDASGHGASNDGGTGTGGTAIAEAFGASTAKLDFKDNLSILAQGAGGSGGYYGPGGDAHGGTARLQASNGSTIHVGGDAMVSSNAWGGYTYDFGDSSGGNATGGISRIQVLVANNLGGTIDIDGGATVSADGSGGSVYWGSGGVGGDGTGGSAKVSSALGTITIGDVETGGDLDVSADGFGGDAYGGYGGSAQGGDFAEIDAIDGDITIQGHASVSASGYGGNGVFGGDGQGSGDNLAQGDSSLFNGGAHIAARNGDIVINGGASVTANGTGGNGGYDNGYFGDYGTDGGSGGNGTGGWATIEAANSSLGASLIDITGSAFEGSGYASVSADGFGGSGGNANNGFNGSYGANGSSGTPGTNGGPGGTGGSGGTGGAGGNATGGFVSVTAASDNGYLDIVSAYASAIAVGGEGGNGGSGGSGGTGGTGGNGLEGFAGNGGNGGDGGMGGNGGLGGSAIGGHVTVGTVSGNGQAFGLGLGSATFGSATLDASATGGWGGNGASGGQAGFGGSGGFGSPNGIAGSSGTYGGGGNGGDGGDAVDGTANLLVRGSTLNVDSAVLTADATGGNAGFGFFGDFGAAGITGVGGDATVGGDGGISLLVTSRYLNASQRGTLNAGDISGTAIATSGIGIPNGISTSLGGNGVTFLNSDGHIGSLDFLVGLGSNPTTSGVDSIAITNGQVAVDGGFSFSTPGNLSLFANDGDMHAGYLNLAAGNFVFDPVNDPPSNRGTYFADGATITTGQDFVTSANLDIGSSLVIDAPGLIDAYNFTVDGNLDLIAEGGSLTAHNLDVTGAANLSSADFIALNLVQAGLFHAEAATTFNSLDITSDSNIQIFAGDDVTVGELVAGTTDDENSNKAIRIDSGGSVLAGNILTAGGIDITAIGSVTGGNVTTGDGVFTDAGGAIQYGNISAGLVNPQEPSEDFAVGFKSGTSITVGNVDASRSVGFLTSGSLTTGDIDTGADLLALVHGAINIGDINADGRVYLADYSMFSDLGGTIHGDNNIDPEAIFGATPVATGSSITVGDVVAGSFQAAAGTSLTIGTLDTVNGIELHGGGAIITDDITAGDFVLANGGSITVGDVDAFSLTLTSTAGDITAGDINASGNVAFDAFGDILAGDIIAGGIDLSAGDDIVTGDLTTEQIELLSFGEMIHPFLTPGASITLNSGGDISTGDISSFDGVYANAGGTLSTGTIDAGDFVDLSAFGNVSTGYIDAGGYVDVLSTDGAITTGNLTGTLIDLDAADNIAFGTVSGDELHFETGGSVNGGNIAVTTRVDGDAGGNILLGNIAAGPNIPVDDFSVGIAAMGNITVGNVNGAGRVGFATLGNLVTGSLTGGQLVMALVGGNTAIQSITTPSTGRVYLADVSMFVDNGGVDDFDADAVLAATPVASHGSLTISGNVSTGQFQAAENGITTANIDAPTGIYLDSTGGISTGILSSNQLIKAQSLASIQTGNVTTNGGIDFLATNNINTGSVHSGGNSSFRAKTGNLTLGAASVGGNLTARADAGNLTLVAATVGGTIDGRAGGLATIDGALNASLITLTSNDIDVGSTGSMNASHVDLVSTNATQTIVGDGVTGSGYELSDAEADRIHTGFSVIADTSLGAAAKMLIGDLTITVPGVTENQYDYEFATQNGDSSTSVGTVKVVGDVTFTGLSLSDEVAFRGNLFELDAATGSVNLFGTGTTLGGILGLYAPKVWVASGAILTKLEANPLYSTRVTELNLPATVQRPEGVLRAASFDIDAGDEAMQSLLVQNTGTAALPAGFLVTDSDLGGDTESGAAAGSIDLVINGQIITQGGTLTGIAVRDLLVTDNGSAQFVAGSTINGCPLVGPCVAAPPPPPPVVDTVAPTDVQLTDNLGLGDGLFGNEPDIAGEDGGDLSSPITPPIPLFDSRPLAQTADVDDPVSGAGNPSLYGSSDQDDGDDTDEQKKKKAKKGDGK